MKYFLSILALCLLVLACQKNNDSETPDNLPGMYSGTFNRTGVPDTSDVTLSLDQNKFEGESSIPKFPAICGGSFEASQNSITFVDSCAWTADFDWTLILNGTYNLSFRADNEIRIWRTNGTITDEYLLKKRRR